MAIIFGNRTFAELELERLIRNAKEYGHLGRHAPLEYRYSKVRNGDDGDSREIWGLRVVLQETKKLPKAPRSQILYYRPMDIG